VIAGGIESMSRAPYALPKNPRPFGPSGNVTAYDTSLGWRFPNPRMAQRFPLESMGETAENVVEAASRGEVPGGAITRSDQDAYALESHARAVRALRDGSFDDEVVPVEVRERAAVRGVRLDEHPRYRIGDDGRPELATSFEQLAALEPVFRGGGTVTAGNASGLNDGAAALLLMRVDVARARGLRPLARWLGGVAVGVDPRLMGLGPVPASQRLLQRFDLSVGDLELIELNEAFAAQALAVIRSLGLDHGRTNVHGGAVALGHPLGASGARILTTLVHALQRGDGSGLGLATLCVGVGQGESTLVERL
jgi:acetyl-CoA acetyltransferase family protein